MGLFQKSNVLKITIEYGRAPPLLFSVQDNEQGGEGGYWLQEKDASPDDQKSVPSVGNGFNRGKFQYICSPWGTTDIGTNLSACHCALS